VSKPKTKPTEVSADSHIAAIANEEQRNDAQTLSALAGFAVRGSELVVYIAEGFEGRDVMLAKLGKHKIGKVCVYIRRLANVDLRVLETLIARSVAEMKRRYPQPDESGA